MRTLGFAAMAIGVLLIIIALNYDTSVPTASTYGSSGFGIDLPSRTHNLGLLQTQLMLLYSGLAAVIAGTVVASVGHLIERMQQSGVLKPIESPAPVNVVNTDQRPCDWCDRTLPAGHKTCTSFSSEALARVSGKVRDPVCKGQLHQRGFSVAPSTNA